MLAEQVDGPPVTEAAHRAKFFRQSGWLMIANVAGGALMWAVHPLSRKTGPVEYGLFVALLSMAMCIPSIPLQMVMAQQTAKALATGRERELGSMTRMVWLGTSLLWLVGMLVVFFLRHDLVIRWGITNEAALWITMLALLFALWMPLFQGVLQGQQNFQWLGWSMMSNAIGRIAVAAAAVLIFGCATAGMMTGVLCGMLAAVVVALWHTRSLWTAPAQPFDWRALLGQVVPLMLGYFAFQFLFTADTMFVKSFRNIPASAAGFYGSAGTLSRALMWLVGPLAMVMFPRLVHSSAKSEKSNLMGLVLIGTAILSIVGAISLAVLGPYVVLIMNGPEFVKVASQLLPWYAGAMVPLALANVLVNGILARSSFRIVPWLCVLAIAYAFALTRFHDSLVMVLQVLGICNLVLLALCAWFERADKIRARGAVERQSVER